MIVLVLSLVTQEECLYGFAIEWCWKSDCFAQSCSCSREVESPNEDAHAHSKKQLSKKNKRKKSKKHSDLFAPAEDYEDLLNGMNTLRFLRHAHTLTLMSTQGCAAKVK